MSTSLNELQTRHQMQERIARASAPRLPVTSRRHRLAQSLRRVADRVDT